MSLDLNSMSREELTALKGEVEKALKSLDTRRKAEALKAAQDAAREFGFSLADLTESGKPSGRKAAPKYANPSDPAQTWSGRGRQPVWFREAIAAGAKPEDFAI